MDAFAAKVAEAALDEPEAPGTGDHACQGSEHLLPLIEVGERDALILRLHSYGMRLDKIVTPTAAPEARVRAVIREAAR